MKVLFIAAEAFPFARTGGLGDVTYSLPKELRKIGIDARVMIPKYGDIPDFFKEKMVCHSIFNVPVGWRSQYCGLEELKYEGMPFYFIDNEYYFKREGLYGFYDEAERYAFFCRAALESIKYLDFMPDIIHCHDWQTGMVNVILKAHYEHLPEYQKIKKVFTIHNLHFQGIFPKEIMGELLNLKDEFFSVDGIEFYGAVNFMKGGILYSDEVTTVSPTYAKEIQTPHFGERLDDLLRKKNDKIVGIINGIDTQLYNPATDKQIFENYSVSNPEGKKINKKKLQKLLGLEVNPDIPIISIVSRFTRQKGLDLVFHILDEVMNEGVQFVALGTGDQQYENWFKEYASRYPGKISTNIAFDDELARRIYAGSDIFLMPSLFEPCGIGQLLAQRYGTIPIVRETGGLKDTVKPFDENSRKGNGFSFANYNAHDMLFIIRKAVGLYKDKRVWKEIVENAMSTEVGWNNSAMKYKRLYQSLT